VSNRPSSLDNLAHANDDSVCSRVYQTLIDHSRSLRSWEKTIGARLRRHQGSNLSWDNEFEIQEISLSSVYFWADMRYGQDRTPLLCYSGCGAASRVVRRVSASISLHSSSPGQEAANRSLPVSSFGSKRPPTSP
jgi:hypothetical protein